MIYSFWVMFCLLAWFLIMQDQSSRAKRNDWALDIEYEDEDENEHD